MTRVNVVDFDGEDDPLAVEPCPPAGELGTVLYLPVPRWVVPSELDRRANLLDEQWRLFADLVVCRVHPAQLAQFAADEAVSEDLVARFPGVPVLLLSWEEGGFRLRPLSGQLDADLNEPVTEALAHAELRAVLERSGVILPATDGYHYEGPSGEHYESFVRVGTAIQEVDALDAIAFWLLPMLSQSPVLVLDSWTIISLGLNAAQYLRDNPIIDAHGETARVVAVETRRSYSEPPQRLHQHLTALRERHQGSTPPVLAIVSVSSTGETAEHLTQTCQRAGFERVDVLALFRSDKHDLPRTLCVLPEVSRHWSSSAECPHCNRRSQLVRVLPDTFLLDLAATVTADAAITLFDAGFVRRFLGRYAGAGAMSVHRDQHDGQRHHMIFVDLLPLLEHQQFSGQLNELLEELEEIDLILCPEHNAARALGAVVADRLSRPVLEADPQRLLDLASSEREMLADSRRVLIVDDVVITGTRLRHYRNMLHRQGVALQDDFELHVLAGIARPASLERLKGLMDFTHDQDRFHYVELLPLPNWDERECPWCDERKLLGRYGSHAPSSDRLAERFRRLQDTAHGLSEQLFLPWLAKSGEMTDPMVLGPQSIFMANDEPELFCAVASSIQALRNARKLNERLALPVAKVLSRDFAFEGRFYDTVITACLLRATRRHDLRAALVDPELERMAAERLSEPAVIGLHGELLFALHRGHLPGGVVPAREAGVFDQPQADEDVRAVMRAAIEK